MHTAKAAPTRPTQHMSNRPAPKPRTRGLDQEARGLGHESHLSQPRARRYIGVLIESPWAISMVNSTQSRDLD